MRIFASPFAHRDLAGPLRPPLPPAAPMVLLTRMTILCDQTLQFLLHDVFSVESLTSLPHFSDHDRTTIDSYLSQIRQFSRASLLPAYRPFDEHVPTFDGTRVHTHPDLPSLYRQLSDLGVLTSVRSYSVGGSQLPFTVFSASLLYLYGANLHVSGFAGLTSSAAHLIESFGTPHLCDTYMSKMYSGEWTGTMALTEPHAGSSLGDLSTTATPSSDGSHHLLRGSKIFISGGDNSFSENIVHLALARIDGAPPGTRGISLFVVPQKRLNEDGQLEDNDVTTTGTVHKLGWRGLPSVMLSFGDRSDCRGYLVGEPHQGLRYMFQMMNEARIGVGVGATATASASYLCSLQYSQDRTQGRSLTAPRSDAPVPLVAHPDVRRMLLSQKAIVEGSMALVLAASRYSDLALHSQDESERERSQQLLDLLTPIVKTFPSEHGFAATSLSVQIHGGYGYTSEYLPEAYLRDQKLNSIHEGTTQIQALDLLGRKVMRDGGASLLLLAKEISAAIAAARSSSSLDAALPNALEASLGHVQRATTHLAAFAESPDRLMAPATFYLDMLSRIVVAWQWLLMLNALDASHPAPFVDGKRRAAQYWFTYELPHVSLLADSICSDDDSFLDISPESF